MDQSTKSSMAVRSSLFGGIIVGAVAGVAAGLLWAPKSGRETRKIIGDKITAISDEVGNKVVEIGDKFIEVSNMIGDKVAEVGHTVVELGEKAIETGDRIGVTGDRVGERFLDAGSRVRRPKNSGGAK